MQSWASVITKTKILKFLEYIGFPYFTNLEKKEELIDVCVHLVHVLEKKKSGLYKQMLIDQYFAPPNAGYLQTKRHFYQHTRGSTQQENS
jgi:hypothetical protein